VWPFKTEQTDTVSARATQKTTRTLKSSSTPRNRPSFLFTTALLPFLTTITHCLKYTLVLFISQTTYRLLITYKKMSEYEQDQDNSSAQQLLLHSQWTLWFDNPKLAPAGSDWKANLIQVGSFDTAQDFWRIYNNVKPASSIGVGSNYSVFRRGIQPAWEDEQNKQGGKFVFSINKKESKSGRCDDHWLHTVLALIGETMDETGDSINGAVVSIRKNQDRIAIWLAGSDRDVCVAVGERWKKVLNLEKGTIDYQTHKMAAETGRSFRNEPLFIV
jgi:translation initiation factor 4E